MESTISESGGGAFQNIIIAVAQDNITYTAALASVCATLSRLYHVCAVTSLEMDTHALRRTDGYMREEL